MTRVQIRGHRDLAGVTSRRGVAFESDPDECAWRKRAQAITLKFEAARHAISGWRSDTASLMAAAGHRASAGDLGALTPFMVMPSVHEGGGALEEAGGEVERRLGHLVGP